MKKYIVVLLFLISFSAVSQQSLYNYKIDLTQVQDDMLKVELTPPAIESKMIKFYMPKIIPGTYSVSDYGKFVDNFQALDKKGRNLPVQRIDENTWQIKKANKINKITYTVEDTYDTGLEHQVYPMAGSNIEKSDNFVIAPPAFFGYFEDKKEIPFQLTFTKPSNLYASTGLVPVVSRENENVFVVEDYDQLVDSPIMFNEPDTTFINIGNARVLVSVYSPNNLITSEYLASHFKTLLQAEKEYLGGELPVDKYAFLLYFDPAEEPQPIQGALEHSYSSFYYLAEVPQERILTQLLDIASHEFLHIITPLTIHSEKIAQFDFNEPDLSKHLWLYEGVTEYAADHVQVQQDLISVPEYIDRLQEKILISKLYYNDTIPFTELSEKSAGVYQDQYGNVYEKGALIAAMLDIRLNELSNGDFDLQNLLQQLRDRFGPDKPFEDDELFQVITDMTYPEIGDFFTKYVAGANPLPLEDYFQKVGVKYVPQEKKEQFTMGNIQIGYDQVSGNLFIADISQMNEFGKAIGFKQGDAILSIEGQPFTPRTGQELLEELSNEMGKGDTLNVVIKRDGEKIELEQEVFFVEQTILHQLYLIDNPSYEQLKLRNQWLMAHPVTAKPEDVATLDAIINSLYDVISGPAGERDWERFHSLYAPDAKMGAIALTEHGPKYIKLTPKEYEEKNRPVFNNRGFYEEEIGREVDRFANIAQVFSAYQFKSEPEGQIIQRGINSIQLAYYNNRWWIISILWNGETSEHQIPEELPQEN
ncbi:MAG: PDZ domain-containing protein [Candidatus Cyclobacteriaceae bacterium M2_1C_046]